MARCQFHFAWDPLTLAPRGESCHARAVSEIHWKDGRVSYACPAHGLSSLDPDARELVEKCEPLSKGGAS